MNALRDYVDWKLAHSDKVAEAEGYPLVLKKCKKNKRMKGLKVWGHNMIRDYRTASKDTMTLVCDGSLITLNGANSSNTALNYNPNYAVTLKAGRKYTLSLHYISGELVAADMGINFGLRNTSSGWFISLTSRYASNYTATASKTFTVDADTSVCLGYVGNGEFNNLVFGIQLVEGDSVGEYKGYVGEKTVNLYDAKTYPPINGQCIWSGNGEAGQATTMSSTNHIPCSELRGKTITCGYGAYNNPGIAFYDDDKVFISGNGYSDKSTITITVPENASYLRYCFTTDQKDQAMIVEGTTFGDYEPYGKYKIPIVQRGKNLLDFKTSFDLSGSTRNETYGNGYLLTGNISQAMDQYAASLGWAIYNLSYKQKIPVIKGVPITISVDVTPILKRDETRNTATRFLIYVAQSGIMFKNFFSSTFPMELGVKSHLTYTFTPTDYEGDSLQIIISLCSHRMKIENLQVEYGSTDTPYEPYVEPITHNVYVDEPLSANDVLDVKEHMELPKLTAKTTVFTTDTTTPPSKMYGKYIKI